MRFRAQDHGLAGKTVAMHAIDLIDFAPAGTTLRQVTQEGLISPAKISKFGLQVYLASELGLKGVDANKRLVAFRPESEVFDPESSRSFEFNPLANDHTKEDVSPKNWRQLVSAGRVVGDVRDVARDGDHLGATIVVRDQKAIEEIQRGKSQLSCGYDFEADFTPGTFNGVPYDFVQRRIRGNHVAIVDRARGGFGCRIADRDPAAVNSQVRSQHMDTIPVTINGISFRVVAEDSANALSVRDAYDKMSALHKSGCDALKAVEGKFDAMKEHHKAVVAKLGKKDDDEDEDEGKDGKKGKDGITLVELVDIKLAGVRRGVKKTSDAAIAAASAATKRATDAEAKVPTGPQLDALVAVRKSVIDGATALIGTGFKAEGKSDDAIVVEAVQHVVAKDAALKPVAEGVLAGADVTDAKSAPVVAAAFRACLAAKGTVKTVDRASDPLAQILSGTHPGSSASPARAADAAANDAESQMTPQQIRNFRDSHGGKSPRELAASGARA